MNRDIKGRVLAWVLAFVMVASVIMVPADKVKAATSDNLYVMLSKEKEENGYKQYAVMIVNKSGNDISNWNIELAFNENVQINSVWNGASYSGKKIIVETHKEGWDNSTVSNGETKETGAGFQIYSPDIDTSMFTLTYDGGSVSGTPVIDNEGTSTQGGTADQETDSTTDLNLDIDYNYAKLLQYSLYFYDANMCGPDVEDNCSLSWRKNCHTYDQTAISYNNQTVDVSGGFHDAGDHDKFGLPEGYSATMLGIGFYEYKDAYEQTGQTEHFKKILDHFCDYFVRCTVLDEAGENAIAFCYQVGNGDSHNYWQSPESETIMRPGYFADATTPATDQVSEAVAALTIHYLNFGNEEYLDCAKKLFEMAKKNSKASQNAQNGNFYNSSGWADDYCLAAAWLYKATNDSDYMTEFNKYKGQVKTGSWPSWDDVGPYALAYGEDNWSVLGSNVNATKNGCTNVDNGFTWLAKWASNRYNANMQLEGLIYDKYMDKDYYTSWAEGQMKFIMGNNTKKQCYVVGYNENSSKYPHHRASSGYPNFPDQGYQKSTQKYTLLGALVGGIESSDGTYHDDSSDYYCNEVTLDYNAAFTGAVAALYLKNKDDGNQEIVSSDNADETMKSLVKTFYDSEVGTNTSTISFTLSTDPENGVIAEVEEGYRSAGKITVTITNTGDTDLEDLSVSFDKKENTDFEIVKELTGGTLAAGESTSVDISLKNGKSAGKYADSVVVSSGTIKKTKNISQTVTVKKIPLTGIDLSKDLISLEKGENATVSVENSDVVITAEPEGASLGELEFSSSDTKVVTVDEDGNITAVGKGRAVITVSSGAISKELTVDVKVTPQGIDMKEAVSLTLTEGENTDTLVAKVIPEDADNAVIRWEIPKNEIIATEKDEKDSSKLSITALSKGTVTITAFIADMTGTTAAATEIKKDCVITVTQEIESITIDKENVLMTTKGENTKQLIASTIPADTEGVAWSSSNSIVATVSQDGLVTALGSGEAEITAQIGSKKDTCIVKVVKPVENAAITDNKGDVLETLQMQEGDTMKVKGSVTPKDATGADVMEWSVSEGTDIISFDPETGVVTALKEGTAKLTLKVGKDVDNILNTKTAVLQVTVSKKATDPSGGENTDPNGENTDPSGENTDPSGKTTGPDVVIDKPNVINISELPGGAEYKGDSIPDSCYITYTDGVDKPTALYEEGRLTLLLNTDYKLVGTNEMLTITFRKAEEVAGRVSNENIVLDGVTVKAVDADVPVTLTGNTTVKGNVEASNITITAGIVNIGGSVNADDKVTITDGKVTVEDGINAGGEITIQSKATLSVNVARKAENGQSNAITGSAITVEDGAAITTGNNVDSNLFSVAPKNEKGEVIDVSKYTDNKSSDTGESRNNPGNGNSDANNPQQTVGTDITTDGGAQSPQVINATDMTIMADVKGVKGVNAAGTYQLAKGKAMTLSAAFSPEGAVGENITVTSSNAKIVAVNGNKLTAKKAGTATITVTSDRGIVKSFKVKVMKKAVSKVKFKSSKKTVKVGKTLKLKAVTTPAKKAGSKLYWKSANENVATVTQKGIVKGIKKGKVKITAIALDGSGKKATVKITVK